MKRTRGIVQWLLVTVILFAATTGAWADTVPNSTVPAIGSERYYLDLGEALPQDFKTQLVSWNTENKDIAEIVVVTVKSLGGADLSAYCHSLYETWEIGTKEKSKGVLLVMALDEASYFAIAGAGVSTHFGAGGLDQILTSSVEPDFAAARYGESAKKFLAATGQLLVAGTAAAQPEEQPGSGISGAVWGFVQALLIIIGIALALGVLFIVITALRSKRPKPSRRSSRQGQGQQTTRRSPTPRRRPQEPVEEELIPQDQPEDDESFGN